MTKRLMTMLALCAAVTLAHGQSKKELVQKVLQLQQPMIEGIARNMVEQPAAQMMQAAGRALQTQVPADRREAVAKSIDADVKKYVEDGVPLMRERALKLAPSTLGAGLEEKFSEAELKQLVAWLESPVNKKFQQLGPVLEHLLAELGLRFLILFRETQRLSVGCDGFLVAAQIPELRRPALQQDGVGRKFLHSGLDGGQRCRRASRQTRGLAVGQPGFGELGRDLRGPPAQVQRFGERAGGRAVR